MRRSISSILHRGLVVSVQLDAGEPLHTPQHCALFAQAAEAGGAVAVRAEGLASIGEVRATCRLPLIGCTRGDYGDGWMLVTPDMAAVDQLVRIGVDVVALDGTSRVRPNGRTGPEFIAEVRARHATLPIVADISTVEEGVAAVEAGADALSTVLCGRTKETYHRSLDSAPPLDLVAALVAAVPVPVLAEGFIWRTEEARAATDAGAWCVVVGGAITRPRVLTQLFADAVAER